MIALASSAAAPVPAPTEKEIIGHLQKKVSASRLTLFLQCRLKFFFRYVAGIVKAKTAALHVGGTVHAVLKAWNKARWRNQPLTLKELHDEFSKAWADVGDDPVKWENAAEEDAEKGTGSRLVETYIRESNIPANSKPEAVEVPVETDLHQHGLPTLIGVLDLVQAGKIIDYKTSGQTPNAEKVALPRVHLVASLLKRRLLGTHQGSFGADQLEYYLDEFTFRFNRRTSASRGKLFSRLMEQAVALDPKPYKMIAGGKPLHPQSVGVGGVK